VAKALDMPVSTYHQALWNGSQATMVSLDTPAGSGEGHAIPDPVDQSPRPDESLEHEQALSLLAAAIDGLPDSERTMLLLYYDEEMLLREIGAAFELTESRICQIQKKTLQKLRSAMLRETESRAIAMTGSGPRKAANTEPAELAKFADARRRWQAGGSGSRRKAAMASPANE